jgi:mitogen-activated protein kinase kinase
VQAAKRTPVDLQEWAIGLMERDNRKSHLAPQLSPSTQDLLRSTDSPLYPTHPDEKTSPTPTSGEIPIAGAGIISPRDYGNGTHRPPSRNGHSNGRQPLSAHPGLGSRTLTSESIPSSTGHADSRVPASASAATFSLPVRPAPSGPLPPPPPRKHTPDDMRRENRRQGTFGLPPNPSSGYGV